MNQTDQTGEETTPLVVDLDGTLLRTDLLMETASAFITANPWRSPRLVRWLLTGRATLKARLAAIAAIDATTLPYDETLLDWLRQEKAAGRRLVLATASHRRLAEAVARHLDLFDEVLATEGDTNLKSARKRAALVERFGERRFDYVGNSSADIAVWQSARRAHVVGGSSRLLAKARKLADVGKVSSCDKPSLPRSLLRAMRPYQWVKNLLIFVPLLAAHRYTELVMLGKAWLAFVSFGLAASSVYLLNDLVDVAHDRHHPRKRRRPIAAGDLSLAHAWLAWPLLLGAAFLVAGMFLPGNFVIVLASYVALTVAYSLTLKQRAIVDVLALAGLYTVRIVAGAAAVAVAPSFWLLAFSMFLFLSLAFIKRFSELKLARDSGVTEKIRGRGYWHDDLELVSSFGISAGYLSVLILALYVRDESTAELYQSPAFLWLASPLMLFWISRAWLIAHRGEMHDDPIVFALKDRLSWAVGAGVVAVFMLARTTLAVGHGL